MTSLTANKLIDLAGNKIDSSQVSSAPPPGDNAAQADPADTEPKPPGKLILVPAPRKTSIPLALSDISTEEFELLRQGALTDAAYERFLETASPPSEEEAGDPDDPSATAAESARSSSGSSSTTQSKPAKKNCSIEDLGVILYQQLIAYIDLHKGRFQRVADGSLHLLMSGPRIVINFDRANEGLARLVRQVCNKSTVSKAAEIAIQYLLIEGGKRASNAISRQFSAVSKDDKRLYIPVVNEQLLEISRDGIRLVPNGENADHLWINHPKDAPFEFASVDPAEGLAHFERLAITSQSVTVPEMAWFVGMAEGLFPFVRDLCPARFITVHTGGSTVGKTSAAERFVLLHGLVEVCGDFTVATLGNLGDIGLLVADNKEQCNLNSGLIDFFLFISTGGQRGRSNADGTIRTITSRPICVITTIEGVFKIELQNRCVEVGYFLEDGAERFDRRPIQREIEQRRSQILCALVPVLRKFFEIRGQQSTPNPIPNYREHFRDLADLLRAYADVSHKPAGWAEQIIAKWDSALGKRELDVPALESPIRQILQEGDANPNVDMRPGVTYQGKSGTLYISDCSALLMMLRRQNPLDRSLPQGEIGLGRRLHNARFQSFAFLDEDQASEFPELKRKANRRRIGFFVPEVEE